MTTTPLTFLAAAERVLGEAGAPLTPAEITERALAAGLVATQGRTPDATMGAQLAVSLQHQGGASPFVRTAPNTYALRRWVDEGTLAPPTGAGGGDVRVAFLPPYDQARALLPVLAGMPRALVAGLRSAIWEHTGTFAANVDWTEPDRWIPERLAGEHQDAALRIWRGTRRAVNPRHLAGPWSLFNAYDLIADGADGALEMTPRGRDFVDRPDGPAVRELDEREGLLALLALLAEQGPAAPGALDGPWTEYLRRVRSGVRAETTARAFLYHRLRNLLGRGYAARVGQKYEITAAGLA